MHIGVHWGYAILTSFISYAADGSGLTKAACVVLINSFAFLQVYLTVQRFSNFHCLIKLKFLARLSLLGISI